MNAAIDVGFIPDEDVGFVPDDNVGFVPDEELPQDIPLADASPAPAPMQFSHDKGFSIISNEERTADQMLASRMEKEQEALSLKENSPLWRSFNAMVSSGGLNLAAAFTGGSTGKPLNPNDAVEYKNLADQRELLNANKASYIARNAEPEFERNLAAVNYRLNELEGDPQKISRELRGAAKHAWDFYKASPEATNPAAQIGRGLGGVTLLAPTMIGTGGAGLPLAALAAASEASSAAYTAKEDELRAQGVTDEAEIAAAAKTAAESAELKTGGAMAAYVGAGALAGKVGGALAGEAASPMARAAAGAGTALGANVGVSATLAELEGGKYNLQNLTQDALFAVFHGLNEYKNASPALREKAGQTLKESEAAAQKDVQNIIGGTGDAPRGTIVSMNKTLAERAAMLRPLSTEEAKVVATEGLDAVPASEVPKMPEEALPTVPEIAPQLRGETTQTVKQFISEPDLPATEKSRRVSIAKEIDSSLFQTEPLPEAQPNTMPAPGNPEAGGIFTKGKRPPPLQPIGKPPSGNAKWLKIEPFYKRPGIAQEGAAIVLAKQENPIGKRLGRATNQQFDAQAELEGKMWKKMDDAVRGMPKARQQRAFDELATFTREKESRRPVPALSADASRIQTAWEDIAEFTGLLARAKGVKVASDTGYRPMRLIGRAYVPRMYAPEFTRAIREPNKYAADFNRYANELATSFSITPDQAATVLNDMAGGKGRLASNDFMGNIEIARGEKLPESFYDYDMRRVIGKYVSGYANRMGQIIAYGQRLEGPHGPVQKNLWDIARDEVQGGDKTTAQWVNEAEAQSTGERQLGAMGHFGRRLQTLATGFLLSNPVSTVPRNLLSGLETAVELTGTRRTLAAASKVLTRSAERLGAKEIGVLKDDMAALLHAEQLTGDNKTDAAIRWVTDTMLKASGYNASENFVRMTNFLAGSQFARDAAVVLKAKPDSRRARQMAGLLERMGVKPDDIAAENGEWKTGEQTRKFIRTLVQQSQGGYKFNQVPLWAGTPAGRFFYQFGRWGTQRAQNLWNNVFKPAFVGTESTVNGTKMSVRDFKPMVRMALGTVVLGEAFALIPQLVLGKDRRDASLTEISTAMDDDQKRAIELALSRGINDVIMSGSLGIFGQPIDIARAAKDQSRLKNPAEPPGASGLKAATELAQNFIDQGTLTGDDVKRFAASFVPGVSATVDVARNALDSIKYEAENDQRTLRMAGLRFAEASEMDVSRGAPGVPRKTENTPTFAAIRNALIIGDEAEAKRLKIQHLASTEGGKQKALQSLKQSVNGRQPFRVGPFTNEKVKGNFYQWAAKNLSAADLEQVKRVQARYERTASAVGLW